MKEEIRKVNIEDLFTEERAANGVWFEPRIKGQPCGIEFLVTGTDSDENVAYGERYDKQRAELEDLKDPVEKAHKMKIIDANFVASYVKGVKSADGCETLFGGKPLEYSVPFIQELLLKAPLIKMEIVRFARETANFMKREKNA